MVVAFALVGCAALGPGLGPTRAANWEQLVAVGAPAEDGPVVFSSVSEWYPDQQGFEGLRALGSAVDLRQGVFALTVSSLVFLQWHPPEKKYNVIFRVPYSEIRNVQVDRYGRNRRIVITPNDYRIQSFMLSGPMAAALDAEATAKAVELLQSKVTSSRE